MFSDVGPCPHGKRLADCAPCLTYARAAQQAPRDGLGLGMANDRIATDAAYRQGLRDGIAAAKEGGDRLRDMERRLKFLDESVLRQRAVRQFVERDEE